MAISIKKKTLLICLYLLIVGLWTPDVPAYSFSTSQAPNLTIIRVPQDVSDLQQAIDQIPDGGIIEMATGTYSSPSGGFYIRNLRKGFTIQAASGANVTLDGGGSRQVVQFSNTDISLGKPIVFDGITFANGVSSTSGLAAGVTVLRGEATFLNCTFLNNHGNSGGNSPGGALVAVGSTVYFSNCSWTNNTTNTYGGGLALEENSTAYIHKSTFSGNSTSVSGHSPTAAGGGIHVGNSILRVTNSLFENNQSGYVGGALYTIGTWTDPISVPRSDVIVTNSDFVGNFTARHPSVSFPFPTEGGAVHIENQSIAKIFNSRFEDNYAEIGGGLNLYRSTVEVYGGVFQGNRATGAGAANGFGGAIAVNSNDAVDPSTNYGASDRPTAFLLITDTLIQGRTGGITSNGQTAGGIYITGDKNRYYGENGVPQMGSAASNRATVLLTRVVLDNLAAVEASGIPGTGVGGAIVADLANLTVSDSLIINSDAVGSTNSSGGGVALLQESIANISDTTFAGNSSGQFGGGIFAQGSTINVEDSNFIGNYVINGTYGAAIFASPMEGRNLPVNGTVAGSTFSDNVGLTIFDDDRTNGPINDIRYNSNQFFAGDVNAIVYSNPIYPYSWKTTAELNNMVVVRNNGTTTDKSVVPNTSLGSRPTLGVLIPVPPDMVVVDPEEDPVSRYPAYLGYVWSGSSATLDGNSLGSNAGVSTTTWSGTHTLNVGGSTFQALVKSPALPDIDLNYNSSTETINWSLVEGQLQDLELDQGIDIPTAPTGSVSVPSSPNLKYSMFVVAEEGGHVSSIDTAIPLLSAPTSIFILAGQNIPVNYGYLNIYNTGGQTMYWTATSLTPGLIATVTNSGQTDSFDSIALELDIDGRSPGDYVGYVDVDAGSAGTQTVEVTVRVVSTLRQIFLPVTNR